MNLYAEFRKLIPEPALLVGVVTATDSGVATVTLPGGGLVQARGDAPQGATVFVRDGVIEGPAPSLTVVTIDV